MRIHVPLGRDAGVRPADLVGAIANEAGIDSREIGAIEITDRFSLVEVPDRSAARNRQGPEADKASRTASEGSAGVSVRSGLKVRLPI